VIVAAFTAIAFVAYEIAARAYRRRFPNKAFSRWHDVSFASGLVCIAAVLSPRADAAADASFSAHMAEHLTLMLVAPPLVLLGAPMLLCATVVPASTARVFGRALHWGPIGVLTSPAAAFMVFVAVLWVAHFSALYEASLEHEWIHVLEHAAFVGAAFAFWIWILPVASLPRPVPYPVRLLLLFLAIPQGAFLAVALQSAPGVLYPHYVAMQSVTQALADQRMAAAIMWIGGGTLLFVAFMAIAAEWASSERGTACA
jgi:cytochrome c oxidase assembly factor CtaG